MGSRGVREETGGVRTACRRQPGRWTESIRLPAPLPFDDASGPFPSKSGCRSVQSPRPHPKPQTRQPPAVDLKSECPPKPMARPQTECGEEGEKSWSPESSGRCAWVQWHHLSRHHSTDASSTSVFVATHPRPRDEANESVRMTWGFSCDRLRCLVGSGVAHNAEICKRLRARAYC